MFLTERGQHKRNCSMDRRRERSARRVRSPAGRFLYTPKRWMSVSLRNQRCRRFLLLLLESWGSKVCSPRQLLLVKRPKDTSLRAKRNAFVRFTFEDR